MGCGLYKTQIIIYGQINVSKSYYRNKRVIEYHTFSFKLYNCQTSIETENHAVKCVYLLKVELLNVDKEKKCLLRITGKLLQPLKKKIIFIDKIHHLAYKI